MSESRIATARQAVNTAMASLRTTSGSTTGQDLFDTVAFWQFVIRQAQYEVLHGIARLENEGEFAEQKVRPAPAVADLLRCTPGEARRMVAVAESVFPTSLHGQALEPL
ncbi:MAG TPA: hypothetical protein VH008_21000, partial [Pseudonocardia sp.]|nr:hypothetical protein [Pseudonocardia sp.]